MMRGDTDEGSNPEYYVTAEYNGKILNNSGNVNVNNPEPRIKITPKSSSSGAKPKTPPKVNKPKPQPDSPKGSTHQGSKNNQPDKKGIIKSIKLTDLKGNAFKKRPRFGERIQLVIEGKDIKGKSYRLKIWEDDITGKNDLLYNREHKFNGDKQIVYIDLTDDMQKIGEIGNNPKEPDSGEYLTGNYQEIYAEVILQNISTKSQIIDVDLKTQAKKQIDTATATSIGNSSTAENTPNTCKNCTKEFTLIDIQSVFPAANNDDLRTLLLSLNQYREKFSLDTCAKKAHFFAQCIEESGRDLKGALVGEGLQYTPEQLVVQFDNFRSKHVKGSKMENTIYMGYKGERLSYADRKKSKPTQEAYKYGKTNNQKANEKMIATIAYGNRNGNKTPEDAWNFRGRGLLQITGRGNYSLIQDKIDEIAPQSKVNVFEEVPEQGYTPHKAAITGMAEWVLKSLNTIALNAKKDNDDSIVNQIVDKLNDATNSRAKRIVHYRGGTANAKNSKQFTAEKDKNGNPKYKPTKEIFKVNDCILLNKGSEKTEENKTQSAPWVPYAVQELKNYGGIRQTQSPLKERVVEYFKVSKADWYDHTGYWCGAFIRWCFVQTKDYNYVFNSYNSVTAFNWLASNHSTTKGKENLRTNDVEAIQDLKDVFVGAIIVFDFSHVAFVVGQTKDGNSLIYVGGNQSDKAPGDGPGKRTVAIGKVDKSKFNKNFWVSKPKKYTPTQEEKNLPKMDVSAQELDKNTSR